MGSQRSPNCPIERKSSSKRKLLLQQVSDKACKKEEGDGFFIPISHILSSFLATKQKINHKKNEEFVKLNWSADVGYLVILHPSVQTNSKYVSAFL